MRKPIFTLFLLLCTFFSRSQTLGGYSVYRYLTTAVNPAICNMGYVTHLPDDSIWVNFQSITTMTGDFSAPSMDESGYDLLLETGFNLSEYSVQLLKSNGQYSATRHVTVGEWALTTPITWKYLAPFCYADSQTDVHYILPLDFIIDFGLTATDTVTGIKIIFTFPSGDADFAGAYIISPQSVGLDGIVPKTQLSFSPNPFSGKINITVRNSDLSLIRLYDMSSRKILEQEFTNSVSLNTEGLEKGIYLYEIRNKKGVQEKGKVVKQ